MTNLTAKKIFTESLKDLVSEKLTLFQALKIMAESRIGARKIKLASDDLAKEIEKGHKLSTSLLTCPEIDFDSVYISFISFAEQSGNFVQILDYLLERTKREEESRNAFLGAMTYPVLVISLVIVMAAFFVTSGFGFVRNLLPEGMDSGETARTFAWILLSFFLISGAFIFFLWNTINDTKLYEAFLAGGFLVENGINLAVAVGMAAEIAGVDNKNGICFEKAREGLEYGMDLRSAFFRVKNSSLQNKIEMALFLAEETGNKKQVLLKIADEMKKENERKRKLCLTLIEPAFILLTGVFLLEIVISIVLPVVTDMGF